MDEILNKIILKRQNDLKFFGETFGENILLKRDKKTIPFLKEKGLILEIKRKSPSKGHIAKDLNAVETAKIYSQNGAAAISVLTEQHFFGGSLKDLKDVSQSLENLNHPPAVLRKDFLLNEKEIEVSYYAGADAVLLIARILDEKQLFKMAQTAVDFQLGILFEVRSNADLNKLFYVFNKINFQNYQNHFICGVNARDLNNFSIDLLYPLKIKTKIQEELPHLPVVFESGILSKSAAVLPALMGVHGILMGESAAKNPVKSIDYIRNFKEFSALKPPFSFYPFLPKENNLPLIKICGLKYIEDVEFLIKQNVDFLGFVLDDSSPRAVDENFLKEISILFKNNKKNIQRVGVIADEKKIPLAVDYFKKGYIDCIQFHGIIPPDWDDLIFKNILRFPAVILKDEADLKNIEDCFRQGYPRILIDSGKGSGKNIQKDLILKSKKLTPLWLAGGIGNENILSILNDFKPELVDISSSLEEFPGKKSFSKMESFFKIIKGKQDE